MLDRTELLYQMSASFVAGTTRGVRYDDPYFQIRWPLEVTNISLADRAVAAVFSTPHAGRYLTFAGDIVI